MKFTIDPQHQPKKVYKNLPEKRVLREPEVVEEIEQNFEPTSGDGMGVSLFEKLQMDYGHLFRFSQSEKSEAGWKNSRWTGLIFIVALGVLGALSYFALGYEQDLKLEQITVEGAELLTKKELISLAEIDRKEKFYAIDLKKIAARLEKHALVKTALPRRESNPATIVLEVKERQPVAIIRAQATGETLLIDKDGIVLKPKLLTGLKHPEQLLNLPLLSGISERDTAGFLFMSRFVMQIRTLDSGKLANAIGEVKKTSTGAYVLYTSETETPIFIGSPKDLPFITSLEAEKDPSIKEDLKEESHFEKQLRLLSTAWQRELEAKVRSRDVVYVDARFLGQVVVKGRGQGHTAPKPVLHAAQDSVPKSVSRPFAQGQ